jgi:hypothetical protein
MTDLFDIKLWMYPSANPDSDPSLWGLDEDISSYIRHPGSDGGQVIAYSGGKGDEAPSPDAGQMTLTLDNRDGRFSTDNILGPYYGNLDISTPIRMGVTSFSDTFTRTTSNGWGTVDAALGKVWTVGGTASNWGTDGAKANVIIPTANTAFLATPVNANAKDVDITVTVIPAAVATGGRFACGIEVRGSNSGSFVRTTLGFDVVGALKLDILRYVNGVSSTVASTVTLAGTYSAGQRWRFRVQADGGRIRAKAWLESGSEPATWNVSGSENIATGSVVNVYLARFAGNSNSGATTIMSLDDFRVVGFEFTGSVVSWPLRWDKSGNNSWAPITAAGTLRRMNQGTYPIQSPLRRQLGGTADVAAYWPMEDGSAATSFSSATPGALPATFAGVTPASDNTLPGGGVAPVLNSATGSIVGRCKRQAGTGFSVMFFFKLPSIPGAKTRIARIRTVRGDGRIWDLSMDSGGLYVETFLADGTASTSVIVGMPSIDVTQWMAWQLETDNSGGVTTDFVAIINQIGTDDFYYQSGSIGSNTITQLSNCVLTGPSGTAFAHLWMGQNTLPFVSSNFIRVSSGYAGETAAARFGRVCTEAGIPYIVRPGDSERMGAQKEGGTLAILKSCVETDYGVMAERGAGLEFIPRTARWNAAAALALSVASGHIDAPPEPVRDDQRLRNKWTVSRTAGGQAVAQNDASIARQGIWEDSATINTMDDTVLTNHAAWRTFLGTGARLRWPGVSLNFARNPLLLPYWRTRGYGWRFTVDTDRLQVYGNEPDLIMEGFSSRLWPNGWELDMNSTSASVWKAAVTDDTGILGRADNEYCQTTALISSTATTIPITTTSGPRWDNTAALWTGGVDFNVGGERVTVTSITNGVDPAQTLNVSARGVGGSAASHASGASVHLWDPPIAAL